MPDSPFVLSGIIAFSKANVMVSDGESFESSVFIYYGKMCPADK